MRPDLKAMIERGARAITPWAWSAEFPDGSSAFNAASARKTSLRRAEDVLRSALPGLFTEPPECWVAPWEATDEMMWASMATDGMRDVNSAIAVATVHGCGLSPEYLVNGNSPIEQSFAAMRDAHLAALANPIPDAEQS